MGEEKVNREKHSGGPTHGEELAVRRERQKHSGWEKQHTQKLRKARDWNLAGAFMSPESMTRAGRAHR